MTQFALSQQSPHEGKYLLAIFTSRCSGPGFSFTGGNTQSSDFRHSFAEFLSQPLAHSILTGSFPILTGTLPVRNMHFDQCSCGSLPVLPVQPPKGGCPHQPAPGSPKFRDEPKFFVTIARGSARNRWKRMKDPTAILKLKRPMPTGSPEMDPTESVTGIVMTAVRETDEPVISPTGASDVSPRSMLGLVTYCYAKGIYGSSEVAQELRDRMQQNSIPDAKTIRRFRRLNRGVLQTTLEKALRLIRRSRRKKAPVPAPGIESSASDETIIMTRREAADKIETAAIIDVAIED